MSGDFTNGDVVETFFGTRAEKRRGGRRKGSLGKRAIQIREFISDDLTARHDRMTVRQVFYAAEVAGVVEKTEAGYRQVQAQLSAMRRERSLSWDFIADGTRWQRKPATFNDADDFMAAVAHSYRRDLWQDQGVRIEIWLEKDALADIVYDVAHRWNVSLMVSRGQSSLTFLHAAAETARIAREYHGLETHIYALYDHDAGGERASRSIAEELPELAGVPVDFQRLAVTPEQIVDWQLPTRPPKRKDPEAAKWGDKPAVELDAIRPDRLRGLVEGAVTRHIDERRWEIQKAIEAEERQGFRELVEGWR